MKYKVLYKVNNKLEYTLYNEINIFNIDNIKYDISKKLNILPEYIILKYNNVELEDYEDLNNIMKDECLINMFIKIKVRDVFEVKEYTFEMEYGDSVCHLISKLYTKLNVKNVILNCGSVCKGSEYLLKYLYKVNCVFTMSSLISVTVVSKDDKTKNIEAYQTDIIKTIKYKLENSRFNNYYYNTLMIENTILEDDNELYFYTNNINVYIFVGFFMYVKIYNSKECIKYIINVVIKISRLKELLSKDLAIESKLITLTYNNEDLRDEETVGFYKIKEYDTLQMIENINITIYNNVKNEVEEYFIKKNGTISDLKKIFSKKNGTQFDTIIITLNNQELKNDDKIGYLNIYGDSLLNIQYKNCQIDKILANNDKIDNNKIQLFITSQLDGDIENICVPIYIDSLSSIDNLRDIISCELKKGLCGVNIYYKEKILTEGSLINYGIASEDYLMLKPVKTGRNIGVPFILKIENMKNGERQQYMIEDFMTVGMLKKKLAQEHNVNIKYIRLTLEGEELKEHDIIKELNIENGSKILLEIEEEQFEVIKFNFKVRSRLTSEDDCREISEYINCKVEVFREKVKTTFLLESENFVLSFKGEILKIGNILNTYDIKDGDEVIISESLFVKQYIGNDTYSARVKRYTFLFGDKVSDLISKIMNKTNIDSKFIKLSFNGEILEETSELKSFGVENESYLFMMATLAGGY